MAEISTYVLGFLLVVAPAVLLYLQSQKYIGKATSGTASNPKTVAQTRSFEKQLLEEEARDADRKQRKKAKKTTTTAAPRTLKK
jgi:hypothetical protein